MLPLFINYWVADICLFVDLRVGRNFEIHLVILPPQAGCDPHSSILVQRRAYSSSPPPAAEADRAGRGPLACVKGAACLLPPCLPVTCPHRHPLRSLPHQVMSPVWVTPGPIRGTLY